MLRVNGLYGHVKSNDLRSTVLFAGFLVAFQLVAAVTLVLPLYFLDVGHLWLFNMAGYVTRYVPIVLTGGIALFFVQFLRHVASVRSTADFDYVERRTHPRLFNIVEAQAIAAGLPLPKVGLIESPARNAFACGLSARSAVVVATRGLIEALDDNELAAVVAHEVSHIKNGDIRLMAAAAVMMDNMDLLQRQNPLRIVDYRQVVLTILLPPFLMLFLGSKLITGLAFALARGSRLLISASREFVADAEAVRMTHDPAALISALRRIEGRSAVEGISPHADAMMIDGPTGGAFASHPTITERIAVLTRLSGTMAHARYARKDTRPMEQVAAHRDAVFGRKRAPAERASLFPRWASRSDAGSGGKALGLMPVLSVVLLLGFAGYPMFKLWRGGNTGLLWSYVRADAFKAMFTILPNDEGRVNGIAGTFSSKPRPAR